MLRSLAICAFTLAAPISLRAGESVAPNYEQLHALPFPELKASLERAGWPAGHVEAFVNAEIQRRLNPPVEFKFSDLRTFEFWRTGPDAQPLPPAKARVHTAEQDQRNEAVRKTYEELFPSEAPDPSRQALLRWDEARKWGNLSEEKRRAVNDVATRVEYERSLRMEKRGGMLTASEWEDVRKILRELRTSLNRLLTPEELLDYDLRNSNTAERMRSELDNFQPTRAEFVAIFRQRHPLELDFCFQPTGIDADLDRRRALAETSAEKAIAAELGVARYDDYRLSLEPACQTLQFDGRFAGADASTIRSLFRSLLATRKQLAEANSLPVEKRSAPLAALKGKLFREFRAILDEEGTRRYLQEQGLWP